MLKMMVLQPKTEKLENYIARIYEMICGLIMLYSFETWGVKRCGKYLRTHAACNATCQS
jgi:hypothetical protein